MAKPWTAPSDLRERMLAHTQKGTNLDPDGPAPVDPGDTVEGRLEKARNQRRKAAKS